MKKILLSLVVILFLSGCAVFKSERENLIPNKPTLNSEDKEKIRQQAKVNVDLAEWIKQNGVKPGDERIVTLENGCRVILKYTGFPVEDVDGTNLKNAKKIVERAEDVAQDFAEANAGYDDALDEAREKQIYDINHFWDWKKILGGGIITWIVVAVAVPVLCALFPVIIPFISFAWQGLRFGLRGAGVLLKFGFTGIINVLKAIEKFRDENKGTEVAEKFNTHMSKELDGDDKAKLDAIKNKFDI